MKIFTYILIGLATALIIYNVTFLNFDNLLSGESGTALVGVLASSCVIVLMIILLISKAIAKKAKK